MNSYEEVRSRILPGDVIAFGGKGDFSALIKAFLRAPVSHVGIVLHVNGEASIPHRVMLLESTSLYGKAGVQVNPLSLHVKNYGGEIWWLPLSAETRIRFDTQAFVRFATAQIGKAYDFRQVVGSALDRLDFLFENEEDFSRFFCSELVSACLQEGGALPESVNASEETPIDVIRWDLYADCLQLSGEPRPIQWGTRVLP